MLGLSSSDSDPLAELSSAACYRRIDLFDLNGQVLGVVFGAAVDDNDTGFVLTAKEVATQLAHIGDTAPVATGACVS